MRRWVALVAVAGCTGGEPPATLDEAMRAWWRGAAVASDEELALVAEGTLASIDLDAIRKGPDKGSQSRLSADDVADVDFTEATGEPRPAPDPSLAGPVYVIEHLDCTLDQFAEVVTHPDQATLYGDLGRYTAYERAYHEPREDFLSGASPTVSWQGTLTTESILFTYEMTFEVVMRRVPVPAELGIPGDEVIVTRDWLPFPARVIAGQVDFQQDYQLEITWADPEGGVVHVYPLWRQIQTALGNMDNEAVASFNQTEMIKWGKRTSSWCVDGLPE